MVASLVPTAIGRRPSALRLLGGQIGFATSELWRSRVAFVFTFLFPLTWLLLLGVLVDNAVVDDAGTRVMQYVTPVAAAMGVLYGTFPTLATTLASARERGTLRRIRGTPLPGWIYLIGRIGAAAIFAVGSLLTMLVVGVAIFDVQIVWRTAVAAIVTVLAGVGCFAAAGLALASLARSAVVAEAASIAIAVALAFISGLFTPSSDLPSWMQQVADLFPVGPFTDALRGQFDPHAAGMGWDAHALLVMAVWSAICVAVCVWAFPRGTLAEDRPNRRRVASHAERRAVTHQQGDRDVEIGRPSGARLVWNQIRHDLLGTRRNPGWVFFAIGLPVALFAFTMATADGPTSVPAGGVPLAVSVAAGMITWGAAVTAFLNTPEVVLRDRAEGVAKRLRGTPLPPVHYLTGRIITAVLVAFVTAVFIVVVGIAWFGLVITWTAAALASAVLIVGTVTLAACGLALAGAMPSSKAMTAVGLGILLPAAFVSDVFVIGAVPSWMSVVGSVLPIKPMANLLAAALDPGASAADPGQVIVLAAWLTITATIAARSVSWR